MGCIRFKTIDTILEALNGRHSSVSLIRRISKSYSWFFNPVLLAIVNLILMKLSYYQYFLRSIALFSSANKYMQKKLGPTSPRFKNFNHFLSWKGLFATKEIPTNTLILTYTGIISSYSVMEKTNHDSLFSVRWITPKIPDEYPFEVMIDGKQLVYPERYINSSNTRQVSNLNSRLSTAMVKY